MSRRGTNTILMKRCDSPLIVGQQMETRPSSEYGGTRGLDERRLVRDGGKKQSEDEEIRMAEGPAGRRRESGVSVADSSFPGSFVRYYMNEE